MISDLNLPSSHLLQVTLSRTRTAYRPASRNDHLTHVKAYMALTFFMHLPVELSVHSILAFLECLFTNSVSYKVMLNYVSSLKKAATKYHLNPEVLSHRLVSDYLRSISINTKFAPIPRSILGVLISQP